MESAKSLATISGAEPGELPTRKRIGRFGQFDCAWVFAQVTNRVIAMSNPRIAVNFMSFKIMQFNFTSIFVLFQYQLAALSAASFLFGLCVPCSGFCVLAGQLRCDRVKPFVLTLKTSLSRPGALLIVADIDV